MDVKEAIEKAKETLRSVFEKEIVGDVALEEVVYKSQEDAWDITFSFFRPFRSVENAIDMMLQVATKNSTMKVVRVPNNLDKSISIKNYP